MSGISYITRADNPGQPTGGHRTSHRSPPVATAVVMTHFVVARGGQPVSTGGENFHVVCKILQKS